jgi:hypothetical protein
MNRKQFFGGIILMGVSACVFLFKEGPAPIPVGITLTVVGIALVAGSRRKQKADHEINNRTGVS